jgi:hypothetical protein
MYYLQSRYYNPEFGRFINVDSQLNPSLGLMGMNLFCYGGNNPVNTIDSDGHMFMFLTAAIGAVVGGIIGGCIAASNGGNVWQGALLGAAVGGLVGLGVGATAGVLLAGSATASTVVVAAGASALATTVSAGGIGAGIAYIANNVNTAVKGSSQVVSKGYDSFKKLKNAIGSSGTGNEWHHIVEQSQITKSGFDVKMIQNTNNIISVGKDLHRAISGYYSSVQEFTYGLRVRDWLAGQSFQAQYKFGLDVIKIFIEK